VKRVLLTGMSGVGKSSVVARLRELGYAAVDLDEPGWSETRADGEWVWREDRVADLLAANDDDLLFVSGCAENQGRFHERFEHVVLLSAPPGTLVERLAARTNNAFGKDPSEVEKVLQDQAAFEPLLRRSATSEIVTTAPLEDVVAEVLRIAS
jgi:shikimate kinase